MLLLFLTVKKLPGPRHEVAAVQGVSDIIRGGYTDTAQLPSRSNDRGLDTISGFVTSVQIECKPSYLYMMSQVEYVASRLRVLTIDGKHYLGYVEELPGYHYD